MQLASALDNVKANGPTVYPTSTSDRCEINCASSTGSYTIEILSLTGTLKGRFISQNPSCTLDLSPYAAGLYMLRITAGDKRHILKVVKKD